MKDLKLSIKLLLNTVAACILMVILAAAGLISLHKSKAVADIVIFEHGKALKEVGTLNAELNGVRAALLAMFVKESQADRARLKEGINKMTKKIDAVFVSLEDSKFFPQDMVDDVKKIKEPWLAFRNTRDNELIPLIEAGKLEDAKKIAFGIQAERYNKFRELTEAFAAKEGKEMEEENANFEKINGFANKLLIILILAALVLSVSLSQIISRSVSTPLLHCVKLADAIAGGDLSQTIREDDLRRKDEVGQFLNAMVHMTNKLKTLISDVRLASDTIASASTQLSASAEQLSGGVADQAGRTSQIATASKEMSQTVVDIARNTSNIATSAAETVKTARSGGDIVGRSVMEVKAIAETVNESASLMSSLGDRSRQIGEIIGVIKDIADQTNLLALNAAIEAARAGEQGRGFAVVADEVRKLAERTTKATSEIGGMISAIQGEVQKAVNSMDEGTKRVHVGVEFSIKTGDALRGIVDSVNELQSMVQQIATATDEMSSVADQISGDIEAVALVSNETSSSSNQISQASNDLSKLSTNLAAIVGKFKV